MIRIIIDDTYAEREKQLNITKDNGFSDVIKNLEQLKADFNNSCIVYSSFDILLWLFNHMQIIEGCFSSGNAVCITDDEEFCNITNIFMNHKPKTAYQAWLNVLYAINDDIDELFRYSASETDERVNYLRNILMFLSYMKVYDDDILFFEAYVK